jgi:hypothetical protein
VISANRRRGNYSGNNLFSQRKSEACGGDNAFIFRYLRKVSEGSSMQDAAGNRAAGEPFLKSPFCSKSQAFIGLLRFQNENSDSL